MKKKVLFSANLDSFFIKFLIPQLKYFKEKEYEVHTASKNQDIEIPYCDVKHNVCFARGLKLKDNIKSYNQIKTILLSNNYDLISVHTPFGAAITRLAAKNIHYKGKIVYTAHGFHFYKGAPLFNWLAFYKIEKLLSKWTSSIITINKEDYNIAKKKFNSKVYYVPGIGINKEKFDITMSEDDKEKLKFSLGISESQFILIFSGEISSNKNQKLLIETVKILKKEIPKICLLLPGNDLTKNKYQNYSIKLGLKDNIKFLGYRKDIPNLLCISDIAVSSSRREGLPINIIEAMYMGLPVVVTNCRGNKDLVEDGKNGFIVTKFIAKDFAKKVYQIYCDKILYQKMSEKSRKLSEKYILPKPLDEIIKIYEE